MYKHLLHGKGSAALSVIIAAITILELSDLLGKHSELLFSMVQRLYMANSILTH